MKKTVLKQQGYSLVEVLVSISILLVVIAGPMTIASRSMQYASDNAMQTTAFFLAQEGVEYMTALRNKWAIRHFYRPQQGSWLWSDMDGSPLGQCIEESTSASNKWCGIDTTEPNLFSDVSNCTSDAENCRLFLNSDELYTIQTSPDQTPFRRFVRAQRLNTHIYKVTSRVDWETRDGNMKEVTLESYLYDTYK